MMFGKNVLNVGYAMIIPKTINIRTRKGMDPRNICSTVTESSATDAFMA